MSTLRNGFRLFLAVLAIGALGQRSSQAQWGWPSRTPPGPATMMMQMQNMNNATMASDIYGQQAMQAAAMGNTNAAFYNMLQSGLSGMEADYNRRQADRTYYRMMQESQRPYVQEREVIYQQQPPLIHYVQPNQVVQQPVQYVQQPNQQYRYVQSGGGYVPQEMPVQYVQNVPSNTQLRPASSAGTVSVQVPAGARYWVVPGTNPPQVQYDPATGDPNHIVTIQVPL
ncbi:hypothetical protein GC170_01430 [bacterium]|nr:hypothetical protein [bacterium]